LVWSFATLDNRICRPRSSVNSSGFAIIFLAQLSLSFTIEKRKKHKTPAGGDIRGFMKK